MSLINLVMLSRSLENRNVMNNMKELSWVSVNILYID